SGAAGVLAVCVSVFHLGIVEPSIGPAIVTAFFSFGILRIRPWQALVAVTPYLICDAALIGHLRGVSPSTMACWFSLSIAFVAGFVMSVVIDVVTRQTFRIERIIQAQKATIVREQARSEGVLRQELGHQVAARSRELGQ